VSSLSLSLFPSPSSSFSPACAPYAPLFSFLPVRPGGVAARWHGDLATAPLPWRHRAPAARRPRPCPAAAHPGGPRAPATSPRHPLPRALAASCPCASAPRWPTRPGGPRAWPCAPVAPRPGGRARVPGGSCPGVASRAPTQHTCPRHAQRVPAHATVVARRSTFSLIHF
jgi:hypothetical protein